MKSIVIAYEDTYCEMLHALVKRLRHGRNLPGLILEWHPVGGTGKFVREAGRRLRLPVSATKAPPDRVVCFADADRPQNLVPGAPEPPHGPNAAALQQWVVDFEQSWRAHLIREGNLTAEQSARLVTRCVRWSKESLLVSCPDALLQYVDGHRALVQSVLDGCTPNPTTLADERFLTSYRKPHDCLDLVFRALGRRYRKGRDDEDLLERVLNSETHRAEVLRRCPDLDRLLDALVL